MTRPTPPRSRPGPCAAGAVARALGLLDPATEAFEEALAHLARRAGDFALEPEQVHLARELIDLQPDLSPDERLAGVVLVLATLIGQQRGSTRIPLPPGPEGEPFWAELLGALGREDDPSDGPLHPDALRARIEALVAAGRLAAILGDGPAAFAPLLLVQDGRWVSHQNAHARERRVAAAVRRLLEAEHPPAAEGSLAEALTRVLSDPPRSPAGAPLHLSPWQALAALSPFCAGPRGGPSGLTVLTGPPGAGKTATLTAVLRLAVRLGHDPGELALAAPSARAAQRMTDSVAAALHALPDLEDRPPDDPDRRLLAARIEASTLHRLLGWSPTRGRFWSGPERPLAARVVVVDEASMVDIALADALLGALREGALLLLLGDGDQLPPVGCGAFLTELVPARPTTNVPWRALLPAAAPGPGPAAELPAADAPPATPLERVTRHLPSSFRTAGSGQAGAHILAVADAVRRGDAEALRGDGPAGLHRRAGPDALRFEGVEALLHEPDPALLAAFLARWFEETWTPEQAHRARTTVRLSERGLVHPDDAARVEQVLAHHRAWQLLCATHPYPTGVDAVNAALHQHHLRAAALPSTHAFAAGEPVLVVRNDYTLRLFNGDTGAVLLCQSPREPAPAPRAVFPRQGELVAFALPALRERLVLAHALSIHKSQGSEYDRVGVLLPPRPLPLLERRLLYTALTRARRGAVVLGSPDVLRAAVLAAPRRWVGLGSS